MWTSFLLFINININININIIIIIIIICDHIDNNMTFYFNCTKLLFDFIYLSMY